MNHYMNWRRTGDPVPRIKPPRNPKCSIEECTEKHRRNGFCAKHSLRQFRTGSVADVKIGAPVKYNSPEERKAGLKARQRAYDQTPRGKAAHVLKRHRRRHLEGGGCVTLTADEIQIVITRFDGKCFKCKSPDDSTLDHHVPLAKGGKLELSNVVILCRKCNGLKADLDPSEFYEPSQLSELSCILSK